MSLNSKIQKIASKLINKFGTPMILTPVIAGGYNTATAKTSNVPGTPVNLNCVIEEYAESLRFLGDKIKPGSQIIEGDKKVTIAASDVTTAPQVGDKVTVLGIDYRINGIASQTATTGIAIYVMHIRRI